MNYSIKELEQELEPEQIIELVMGLGSDEYVEKQDYIQFKTICHNINPEEASLKLYYYKKNKRFHCYTDCGDNFGIAELFKRRFELLNKPYNFYQDIILSIAGKTKFDGFNLDDRSYKFDLERYKEQKIEVNIPTINKSLLNCFIFYPTPNWLLEGITVPAMKKYNILYSINQNKIIIPHYNINGELIGIRGRSLNPEDLLLGKYMPVQIEGKIYSHPLGYNLYGLNLVKDNIKKSKMAIVFEGEKSCLLYETYFGSNNNISVAACGSSFHQYQLKLLCAAGAEKILIAFDKEGESWKEQQRYYKKLKEICEKNSHLCNMGFIWDTQNLLGLKDGPLDKGKEIFLQLYKNAVWL